MAESTTDNEAFDGGAAADARGDRAGHRPLSFPTVVVQATTQSYAYAEKHFRTGDGHDVNIDVQVSVNIRKLISIDVENQTFRAEVFVRSSWVDESLEELWKRRERVYFADPYFQDTADTNAWSPRIQFSNIAGSPEHLDHWYIPRSGTPARDYFGVTTASASGGDYAKYRVNHIMQVTATFLMSMNLLNFPMDEHFLTVQLKACVPSEAPEHHCLRNSATETKSGLKLAKVRPFFDPSRGSRANKFSLQNGFYCHWSWWADGELVLRSKASNPEDSMGGAVYDGVGAYLHVVRDPWPSFFSLMVVHGLICTGALAVFLYDDPVDRVEPLFTIVTAAVAHKFVAAQNLPHLPHTTILDHYIFCGLGVIFASVIETTYEVKGGPGGDDISWVAFVIIAALWGVYNVYVLMCFIAWTNYGREVQGHEMCGCGDYSDEDDDGVLRPDPRSITPWFRMGWRQRLGHLCGCGCAPYQMMREAHGPAASGSSKSAPGRSDAFVPTSF